MNRREEIRQETKLKKQVNTNTRRMKALMRDVRTDVVRRTKNCQDLKEWEEKLSPYIKNDFLISGLHAETLAGVIAGITRVVDSSRLPSGVNAEVTKGVISECCYTYVSNMTRDMQTEMQRIAVQAYNDKVPPQETAKRLAASIDTIDATRARVIARTETMRASNLSNHIQAKYDGAKSYTVKCDPAVCPYCEEIYQDGDVVFDIDDTDDFPPYHPNCRCTPRYSTHTVEERQGDE